MKILKNEVLAHSGVYKMIKNIKVYFDQDARHWGIFLWIASVSNVFFCFLLNLKISMLGMVFRIYLISLGLMFFLRKINSKTLIQSQILKKDI